MDETPRIFEYAFFGCMPEVADDFACAQAQLMDNEGAFTDLMHKLAHRQPMEH